MPAPSRPELAFEVYLDLGPDRSLARLRGALRGPLDRFQPCGRWRTGPAATAGRAWLIEIERLDPRTAHIPVVIASADATQRQVERLLAAGADRYLTKPLDVTLLLSVIDEFLAQPAPGPPT